ncbi:MAG TPA: hypothetical protein VK141_03010 [Nitrosomonas sp.]|nr:hypothetical protein [Nitrosomonas sp.]
MESIPLKPRYLDALKFQFIDLWVVILVGGGAAYFYDMSGYSIALMICVLIGSFLLGALIQSKVSPVFLTKSGLVYKDWRGRKDIVCGWENEIEIDTRYAEQTGLYTLKDVARKKSITVFKAVFAYPHIKMFIENNCPPHHPLRRL